MKNVLRLNPVLTGDNVRLLRDCREEIGWVCYAASHAINMFKTKLLLVKGNPTEGNVAVCPFKTIKGFPPSVSSDLLHLCEFSVLYKCVKRVILVYLKFS